MAANITKDQLGAGLHVLRAVAETIREMGTVPAGVLYSGLMTRGCTLQQYESIIGILERSQLVEQSAGGQILRWVGPEVQA